VEPEQVGDGRVEVPEDPVFVEDGDLVSCEIQKDCRIRRIGHIVPLFEAIDKTDRPIIT